jgi:predicted NBD/HSP70 family sugar kinase
MSEHQADSGNGSKKKLIDLISRAGTIELSRIPEEAHLSRTTVFNLLPELEQEGKITREDPGRSAPSSKRASLIRLTEEAGHPVGIEVGHYGLRVAVADPAGRLYDSQPGWRTRDPEQIVDRRFDTTVKEMARLLKGVLKAEGIDPSQVRGIGVGIAAPLDDDGVVVSSSFLPDWPRRPLAKAIREGLRKEIKHDFEVEIDNDANLCALGVIQSPNPELAGLKNFVLVKASAGIGAGLVLGGVSVRREVFRGSHGAAGEFGHAPVAEYAVLMRDPDDDTAMRDVETCDRCGQMGCLETFSSGSAIFRRIKQRAEDANSYKGLTDAVMRARWGEDKLALEEIRRAARFLGIALSGLVYLLDPEAIIIGGFLSQLREEFVDQIRQEVLRLSGRGGGSDVKVITAEEPREPSADFRPVIGVQGAVALVQQKIPPLFDPSRREAPSS